MTTEATAGGADSGVCLGQPADRPDRLIALTGHRAEELVAEWSADGGRTWEKATMYPGASVDEWRSSDVDAWNHATLEGRIPPGGQPCLWNYFFDCERLFGEILFHLRSVQRGEIVLERALELAGDSTVVDHGKVVELAGGHLPEPWSLEQGKSDGQAATTLVGRVESTAYASEYPTSHVENAHLPPLTLDPGLAGWHRVFMILLIC